MKDLTACATETLSVSSGNFNDRCAFSISPGEYVAVIATEMSLIAHHLTEWDSQRFARLLRDTSVKRKPSHNFQIRMNVLVLQGCDPSKFVHHRILLYTWIWLSFVTGMFCDESTIYKLRRDTIAKPFLPVPVAESECTIPKNVTRTLIQLYGYLKIAMCELEPRLPALNISSSQRKSVPEAQSSSESFSGQ